MPAPSVTLFSRFLDDLEVPHTREYSDSRFRTMTFRSLFGLTHLLKDYGVPSEGWKLSDPREVMKITPPFLAQSNDGVMMIVRSYDPASQTFNLDIRGKDTVRSADDFMRDFNGIVLLAYPDSRSAEPDYAAHRLQSFMRWASKYFLLAAVIAVTVYFFVAHGIWRYPSVIMIMMFDCIGLWLSYMLLQKSLGIHTAASERVCGVLERGGCDVIATSKASKLFGVFSWSEVGLGYFGVSAVTLLLYPHLWPALAACNILCLPYTVWSMTYQKFVARHWCTLCVGVQLTLWALFICWLAGGWVSHIFPLHADLFVLIGVYIAAVLSINLLLRAASRLP